MKKINISYEWLDEHHWLRELSVEECAKELGVSQATVRRRMRELKVPLRPPRRGRKKRPKR